MADACRHLSRLLGSFLPGGGVPSLRTIGIGRGAPGVRPVGLEPNIGARQCAGLRENRGGTVRGGRLRQTAVALLMLWGLASLPGSLHAAAPSQVVHFTVFSPRPVTDVAYVPRANAAPQPVKFQPTARSVRYEYRGAMPLRFLDPDTREVVAEATIPAGLQDALLLFSPLPAGAGAGGKLRYQVAVLDDGTARHGPGGLAVINLSGLSLSGTVNSQKVELRAGLNPTLAVGQSAKIRLTTVFKQKTYQSYAGTVTLGRNERALLILFPPFYEGALEVQSRLLVDRPASAAGGKK